MKLFSEKQFLEQLTTFIFIEYLENLFLKHNQLPKICSENVFLSFSFSYEYIVLWMLKMPSLKKNLETFFLLVIQILRVNINIYFANISFWMFFEDPIK